MKLTEFIKHLNINDIYDKNIPTDYISNCCESYDSKENYIILSLDGDGDHTDDNPHYAIEFDTYISWKVENSLGDGYITDNFDYIEDLEIEIDLINIEDYFRNISIELDDPESITKIEKWIKSIISV